MVVICLPTAALTGMMHERTARPSTCTVHEPHCATPHPYLVPVSPTCSRIAHNSGVLGSTFTSLVLPLIVNRAMEVSSSGCGAANIPHPAPEGKRPRAGYNARRHGYGLPRSPCRVGGD